MRLVGLETERRAAIVTLASADEDRTRNRPIR